jgi:hypothetical protein
MTVLTPEALADRIDQCAAIMLVGSDSIRGYLPVGSPKIISAALRNTTVQRDALQSQPLWRSLATDPPGPEHKAFFVGHSKGGRMDYVFRWLHPKTGKMAFWRHGDHGNYVMYDYGPDVWHPGPPPIPGSRVEAIQKPRPNSGPQPEGD